VHIPHGRNNRTGASDDGPGRRHFRSKWFVYSAVRVGRRTMVFKMLILLGFLADAAGPFIHSDIHRGLVKLEDYAVHRMCVSRTFLPWERAQVCARNTLFSAHWKLRDL
jgi:hypothetical protein